MNKIKILRKREKVLLTLVVILCFFILGITFNFIAVTSNYGRMPVYVKDMIYSDDSTHFFYNNFSEVSNPYLTDIFGKRYKFSIGDVILSVGGLFSILLIGYYCVLLHKSNELLKLK